MVRMQGLCKLLKNVVYLTKRTEAARFHVKQMQLLYPTYVIFLGLMGELWLFCRRTVQFSDGKKEVFVGIDSG